MVLQHLTIQSLIRTKLLTLRARAMSSGTSTNAVSISKLHLGGGRGQSYVGGRLSIVVAVDWIGELA
jgi:hypothetical protein